MRIGFTLKRSNIPLKFALGNTFLIVNVIVWYFYASSILGELIDKMCLAYFERLFFYIPLFLSEIVSIVAGAFLASKPSDRKRLLFIWTLIGVVSSLALAALLEYITHAILLLMLLMVGGSFGLGLPLCMANFADITMEDNRAQFGSMVFLSIFLTIFAFELAVPATTPLNMLVLALWRLLSLTSLPLLGEFLDVAKQKLSSPMLSLFKQRSVLLYLVPWTMFSMINYLSWPINEKIHGIDFFNFSTLVSSLLAAIFAPVAGLLADNIGRKRSTIGGFIALGIGYAVLGINPFETYAWYFYILIDGIAWGIIYVIFWFTIWGDLAHEKSSEKYYAVGILPYALSGFLRATLSQIIVNAVSEYAIFSFVAFFLFIAVIPLMYAPETLPEKIMKEKEVKSYIQKAKRIKDKFT